VTGLLEREHELARIAAVLGGATGGTGCTIHVEGSAGIGKTSLLGTTAEMARASGYTVLTASGGELEVEFPYGVVRGLFLPVLGRPDASSLLSGNAAPAKAVLSSGTVQRATTGGGLEVLEALFCLTANLAATQPLTLVIDDAHWCDGPSLRFLLYLSRRLAGLPVVLVSARRPGEPGGDESLLDHLATVGTPDVLRPAGLSADGVAAILRRDLGTAPNPAFTAAVHSATGGNPFLVVELATSLRRHEIRPTSASKAALTSIGLDGVQQSILHRLSNLGSGAVALARAISIYGGSVELRHAAELAELDHADAIRLVDALVRVQILRDERRLSFVHPLVRAAIYADLPRLARADGHARAARILARDHADADAVAAHLLEAPPGGNAAVVEHLLIAARKAAGHGATDVAASYLRRALAEPPPPAQLPGILRELGASELAAGQPDAAAERLAAAAEHATDLASRVSIVLMRRHALVLADRIAEVVPVVDQVADDADTATTRDLLEGAALGAGQLDFEVVRRLDRRIARLWDRVADVAVTEPLALAVAASTSAFANRHLDQTRELTDRAIAMLGRAHPDSDYTVEGQIVAALFVCERYALVDEFTSQWLDDARRRGSVPRFISMATMRSYTAYRTGALADAEADARDALEAARLYGHQFWVPAAVAALLNPLTEKGMFDEAEQILVDTRAQELHRNSSAWGWAALLLPARGRMRLAEGRPALALADLLACRDRHASDANRSPALWAWRSEAALALAAIGDHDRALSLADDELTLARQANTSRALGVALRARGLVAARGDGLAHLSEAVNVLSGSPAVLEHARARVDLAAALRRGGRRADARGLLYDALDEATRCGASALAERAGEELLAAGARPHRSRTSGPEALTPSERRVARLAADGRTNPEIAHALFLTRRTVETHLTHAYQKLGISSREQLPDALESRTEPPG
jgi:DNA-binding CsgD family transcriptional regulator